MWLRGPKTYSYFYVFMMKLEEKQLRKNLHLFRHDSLAQNQKSLINTCLIKPLFNSDKD